MNAYELAEIMEIHDGSRIWEHGLEIANMLRQQADRIAELEKQLHPKPDYPNAYIAKLYTTPQTKPLSDEEILQAIKKSDFPLAELSESAVRGMTNFARAIEERHGIK